MSAGMQALFQAKLLAARGDAQQKMEVRAPTPPARPPAPSKRPTDPFPAPLTLASSRRRRSRW